jgi:hypothetical protein
VQMVRTLVEIRLSGIGLDLAANQLWKWLKRRPKREPPFPWKDRTGT